MEADRNRILPDGLDGLVEPHPALLNVDAILREERDQILKGHGSVEPPFFGCLAGQRTHEGVDDLSLALGVGLRLPGDDLLALLDLGDVF